MGVKIFHGPSMGTNGPNGGTNMATNGPNGSTNSGTNWLRMSVWTNGRDHTNHALGGYRKKGLTTADIGVVAEGTQGNLRAGPQGMAAELSMHRGPSGAEVTSRQVRNVSNVGSGSEKKVAYAMTQMKAASIPCIPVYSRPLAAIPMPRRTAMEEDATRYYQFQKAFQSKGCGGSTLGAVQKAVNVAFRQHGTIRMHVDAGVSPPAWTVTFSSLPRLAVANAAREHAHWGAGSSATDSTHCVCIEALVLLTSMVMDMEGTTTMVAVGLASGETTQTAIWFKGDLEYMVQEHVNPSFVLEGTFDVHDASAALISAAYFSKQYTIADPFHVFQLVMKQLPAPRGSSAKLSDAEAANQRWVGNEHRMRTHQHHSPIHQHRM